MELEGTGVRATTIRVGPTLTDFASGWTSEQVDGLMAYVAPVRHPAALQHAASRRHRPRGRLRRDLAAGRPHRRRRGPARGPSQRRSATGRRTRAPHAAGRSDHRERRRPRRRTAGHVRAPPPREVRRRRSEADPQGRRHRRVVLPGPRGPEHRVERGRRPAQGGVRDRPDLLRGDPRRVLRRREAGPRHERQRCPRLAQLPQPARLRGPPVRRTGGQGHLDRPRPGVQRLAHRRVVRLRTGPLHPARDPDDLEPRGVRGRGAARREEGLSRDHVPGEPGAARAAQPALRPLGPGLAGVLRRRARSSACTSDRRASS